MVMPDVICVLNNNKKDDTCASHIHAMFQALYLIEREECCEDVAFLSCSPILSLSLCYSNNISTAK
jgi:hypothetical protein